MKNSQTFSILIWANKAKADANGQIPLYARVTVVGKRVELSLKKRVDPKKWDAKCGFMRGNTEENRTINNHINQVTNDIFRIYSDMQRLGDSISAEEIKNRYVGVPSERLNWVIPPRK